MKPIYYVHILVIPLYFFKTSYNLHFQNIVGVDRFEFNTLAKISECLKNSSLKCRAKLNDNFNSDSSVKYKNQYNEYTTPNIECYLTDSNSTHLQN